MHLEDSFFRKQFYCFSGKGGVGKTALSLATARAQARRGRRTLWIEMTDMPRADACYPSYRGQYEPVQVDTNLYLSRFDLQLAIEEYLGLMFKLQAVADRIARNGLFQTLTQALPGMESLVTLGRIEYELNRRRAGRSVWDAVVLDAPATGHALTLLRFPQAAEDIVPVGPVLDAARRQIEILKNTARTAIVIATLPEELPVTETTEMCSAIDALGYPVHSVWVNGVFSTNPAEADFTSLAGGKDVQAAARKRADFLAGWYAIQQRELARLHTYTASHNLPVHTMPFVGGTLAEQTATMAEILLASGSEVGA